MRHRPQEISEEEIVAPLKSVLRKATEEDVKIHQENKDKEKDAFDICINKIKEHNLEMKLIDVSILLITIRLFLFHS